MAYILFIAALVLLVYLLFILPTKWLKIEHIHHSIGVNKRVLQISDLHVDMLRISTKRIRKVIEDTKPDYIFLTGDFTYRESYLPRLSYYFKTIASCGIPVYAVLGNHDHELPRLQRLLDLSKTYGIHMLCNKSIVLDGFQLIGIDDYGTKHSNIKSAYKHIDAAKPVVVITHDPNILLHMNRPFDYLMAGHFHGKQLNVPFFFHLKSKGPLSIRGIYKGLHKDELGTYYISKGIGQAGVNARFMVRSEVTIHDL